MLSFDMCQAVKRVLGGKIPEDLLSSRALDSMQDVADVYDWIDIDQTTIVVSEAGASWYTFGGGLLNAALSHALKDDILEIKSDSFAVHFGQAADANRLRATVVNLIEGDPARVVAPVDEDTFEDMKFAECVPPELLSVMALERLSTKEAWDVVGRQGFSISKE